LHPGETARVLSAGGHLILVGGWRWLEWRLAGRRFLPVESGEVAGEHFHVWRLDPAARAPE
jgi:hypothetical protein